MAKGIIKTTAKYDAAGGFRLSEWQELVTLLVSKGIHIEEATITEITRLEGDEYGKIFVIAVCENLNLPLWDDVVKQFINRGFTIVETKFYEIVQ